MRRIDYIDNLIVPKHINPWEMSADVHNQPAKFLFELNYTVVLFNSFSYIFLEVTQTAVRHNYFGSQNTRHLKP